MLNTKEYEKIFKMLVNAKEARRHFGVSDNTLRSWDKNGIITAKRTIGGHRRYWFTDEPALHRSVLWRD